MKLKIKEKNDYLRLLNVIVSWDELKDEYEKEYKKIKSNYSMPGFRKGAVPDNIVKKNLGQSIESNFVDHAINIYYKEALEELTVLGGWENRQKKYQSLMNLVRLGFENLKIKPCLDQGKSSCVLNSFYLPEGISYQKLHDELKKDGFIIYAGQGGLKKSFFRISCMGDISEDDIKRFISAIKKIVKN